jgi:hypothetical protein
VSTVAAVLVGTMALLSTEPVSSAAVIATPGNVRPANTPSQPPSALPVPSTSGPLHIATTIPLNLQWSQFEGLQPDPVGAEAPDGAVFVSTGSVVYAVDGDGPPQVAEHAPGHVLALAADATDLYVVTGAALTDYNRSTGQKVTSWVLPGPSKPSAAGLFAEPGVVWAWTETVKNDSANYATLSRVGASGVKVVDRLVAYPQYMDADATGLYFQSADPAPPSGRLAHVTATGTVTYSSGSFRLGSTIALIAGRIVAETPLQANGARWWETYDPSTLRLLTTSGVSGDTVSGGVTTGAGLLGYTTPVGPIGPVVAVSRANPLTGAPESTVQFNSNASWLLEGYYPIVINDFTDELDVVRLTTATLTSTPPTTVHVGPSWSLVAAPTPPAQTEDLNGVSCISQTWCMAVGDYTSTSAQDLARAEVWGGSTWSIQAIPTPATTSIFLTGISCSSAKACTAVGDYFPPRSTGEPLVEAWNGSSWATQTAPNPDRDSTFNGVSCPSPTFCMAVGYDVTDSAGDWGTVAEEWDGATWTVEKTPAQHNIAMLEGVSCTSPTACTAVGQGDGTLAEHWDGTSWSVEVTTNPIPNGGDNLQAVSCSSPSACTAVGYGTRDSGNGNVGAIAEEWDGTAWTGQALHVEGATGTDLSGVSCTSSTWCTAVGNYGDNSNFGGTLADVWDGKTWAVQNTPNPAFAQGSSLNDVSCPSTSNCVAVGAYTENSTTDLDLSETESETGGG